MRHSLASLLILLLVVSCARVPSRFTQAQPRDLLYSGMVGHWRGAVDSADTPRAPWARRPAELVVVPAPERDALEVRFRERTAQGTTDHLLGHWRFGRALDAAEWGGANDESRSYRVVARHGGQNGTPLTVVLEGAAAGGDSAVVRQVIDVGTGTLRLRTEVQEAGGDFMLRRAYVFERAE